MSIDSLVHTHRASEVTTAMKKAFVTDTNARLWATPLPRCPIAHPLRRRPWFADDGASRQKSGSDLALGWGGDRSLRAANMRVRSATN
jgi:hypothetical protein